jgi:hypothetical protein
VDRATVPADEMVVLSINVTGADQATAPSLGGLRGFDVVSTGESRSISMGTGGVASQVTFEYVLRPLAQGPQTIPSISVRVGNQIVRTNPLSVNITAPGGSGAAGAPPTLPMPSVPSASGAKGAGDDVFVRCATDRKEAYVGEQILLTFSLYYATQLGNVDYEPAGTEGFRTYPLPSAPSRYETVKGRQYAVKQEMKLLFPTAPGAHTIAPAKVQYTTGFWDPVPRTLTTEPITIQVARLPEAGKPAGFSGVVGHLNVRADVDQHTIKMGEAATLTISVTGWGNLDAMEAPKPALPQGLRQYQSSEHREFEPKPEGSGFRMGGQALFDQVIIPTTVGQLTIPPVEVAYFDPEANGYDVARSEPVVLQVQPGTGGAPTAEPAQAAQLRPLPDRLVGSRSDRLVSVAVPASQVLAFGWLVVTALVYRRRSVLAADPRLARAHSAARRTTRIVKLARALPPREAAAEIASAVCAFLADKLDVPPATISTATVEALLLERGVDAEPAQSVASLLGQCDRWRFGLSPGATGESLGVVADSAVLWVRYLERVLPPLRRRTTKEEAGR